MIHLTYNLKYDTSYIPFLIGWKREGNFECGSNVVDYNDLADFVEKWIDSIQGEEHCLETYSSWAIAEYFGIKPVEIGGILWYVSAKEHQLGDNWYGIRFTFKKSVDLPTPS